jgi:16S rRNA (cytosine1402-N4)-methyltransferase
VFNDSYKNLKDILDHLDIKAVDGILLDLGLSSYQLEDNSRGFSHKYESSLDMRFDSNSDDYTAEQIIKKNDLKELTKIFKDFGEERHAYKIAKKIKELKEEINVMSITSIVDKVTPYKFRLKTYSRIFQALRIAANEELNHLEEFLDNFINLLNPRGRIVVISYHSVEDRIVKHKLKDLKINKKIELIFKKPLTPSDKELNMNKRARSAKMRVGEKVG